MESYGLEMDDLFEDRGGVEEELDNFETVAENSHEEQVEADATQNEDGDISQQVAEKLRQLGKGAAKKRVLRPQPKLDPARLTGERGIPILPKIFENVKYKGKGHEISDLNKMMGIMEHWGHRLFPKMPFDELIERAEKLGQKKAVQTCVSKIRLDIPLLDSDFVRQVSDDEEAAVANDDNMPPPPTDQERMDEFDSHHATLDDDEEALNDILEQERVNSQNLVLSASTPHPKAGRNVSQSPPALSAELQERIRLNQEKARQRRLNRSLNDSSMLSVSDRPMEAIEPDSSHSQLADSSAADYIHRPGHTQDSHTMDTDINTSLHELSSATVSTSVTVSDNVDTAVRAEGEQTSLDEGRSGDEME